MTHALTSFAVGVLCLTAFFVGGGPDWFVWGNLGLGLGNLAVAAVLWLARRG